MPHGVSQAQGAARTLAACTGHSSTHALQPVPTWPTTCCDRSAPRSEEEGHGWPLGSVSHCIRAASAVAREKAGHGGSPSPLQAARPDPLLSEHGRHVCVWSARSSAVIGRVAFSQAQKQVRDHRPERPQARQRQHQWGGDGVCVCLAQAWADGILPFPREVRTRTVVRNPDFQLSQRENPHPASRQAVGSLLHLFRGWGWACPYLVQCLLQHALGGLPAALGHVAGCLPVEQQQGRGALVGHLLEDVVGVLELLTSLRGRMDITALSPCCPALPQPAPSWRALTAGGPGQAPWGHRPLPHRGP